jgi:hypothetical protein
MPAGNSSDVAEVAMRSPTLTVSVRGTGGQVEPGLAAEAELEHAAHAGADDLAGDGRVRVGQERDARGVLVDARDAADQALGRERGLPDLESVARAAGEVVDDRPGLARDAGTWNVWSDGRPRSEKPSRARRRAFSSPASTMRSRSMRSCATSRDRREASERAVATPWIQCSVLFAARAARRSRRSWPDSGKAIAEEQEEAQSSSTTTNATAAWRSTGGKAPGI